MVSFTGDLVFNAKDIDMLEKCDSLPDDIVDGSTINTKDLMLKDQLKKH